MNLKELRNFDKDDILEMMGLQTKSSTGAWVAGTLATFGIGLLVGAGVGMLLAPKAGRELRDDLRDRLRRIPEDANDAVAAMSGRDSPTSASLTDRFQTFHREEQRNGAGSLRLRSSGPPCLIFRRGG